MQYTTLGNTGVKVSRLCYGTMSFGGDADEDTSAKLFARCLDVGINFFDCANVYAGGRSEQILGQLMKGKRDELVITSKVGFATGDRRIERGLSRRTIRMACEDSLRRLDTDRIDVYFCHHDDPQTPIDETLRGLDDLVRQGKILYAGLSNFSAWQIAKALGRAQLHHLSGIHVLQPMYNLAKRTAEVEILPLASAENLAVTPYSPLGGGLLTGKYTPAGKDESGRLSTNRMYSTRYGDEENYRIAETFSTFADQAGVHPVTLAVAWVKSHPAVTAPIIGARNLEQIQPSLEAGDYEMSPRQREEISALTPPPPVATDRDEER